MFRDGTAVATVPVDLSPGTYYLGAVVDSDNAISEENEANNLLFANNMVTISPGTVPTTPPTQTMVNLPDLLSPM
jgi:subtilase family serine protease